MASAFSFEQSNELREIFRAALAHHDVLLRQLQGAVPYVGTGSPAGVISAPVGSLYRRLDGGAGTTLYVKESGGGGPTGWVAK